MKWSLCYILLAEEDDFYTVVEKEAGAVDVEADARLAIAEAGQ
jgi:hypothetical protein